MPTVYLPITSIQKWTENKNDKILFREIIDAKMEKQRCFTSFTVARPEH